MEAIPMVLLENLYIKELVFFHSPNLSRPTHQQGWDSPDQNRYLGKELEPDEGLKESRLFDKELVVVSVDVEGFQVLHECRD
jgi:hypothetical protein